MELDIKAVYRKLFHDKEYFYSLAKDMELPGCMDHILTFTQENLDTDLLYYDDATVLTYLNLKIYGVHKYKAIKQVVIDEAQDYYPLHFEIFHLLFQKAKFTVLGDINQTLEKKAKTYPYTSRSEKSLIRKSLPLLQWTKASAVQMKF